MKPTVSKLKKHILLTCLSLTIFTVFTGSMRAQDVRTANWLPAFLEQLDPDSAPARDVAALGENADRSAIVTALARHFRSKAWAQPLWVIPFPDQPDPQHDTDRADKAVHHEITTRVGSEQFGETLPWYSPDKEVSTIARFPHFDYLAPAYYHTGDERYAEIMIRDMIDFVDHVPISGAAAYHVQINYAINPWNWVLLQWRVKRWIDALAYLRKSPSVSDEEYLRVVDHIWQEVEWLGPHKVLGLHNGTLGNLSAILYAGIEFPEANRSAAWQNEAGSFFGAFLDTAFYPGEFLVELTVGYSEGTLFMCLSMYEGMPDSPLKREIAGKLERLVDAHVGIMKPDRSLPRYGDHGAYDISNRLLRKSAALFGRPDLAALADAGALGPMPDVASFPKESNPYYLSGYYAMRDGWDREAQYMSIDAGPFGTNHHHGDKLSITVSADGAEFIVDPGTSLYRSIDPGPRYDLRPGFLHNVITIDGVDPNTGWDRHYGFDVLDNRWVTNDRYDFLEGIYEYRNNLLDVIWRRSVLYVKGDYWIIIDALYGSGTHHVESNFQFMIDNELDIRDDVVVATAANGARLMVATAPGDVLRPTVVIGDTTFQGTTFLMQYPTFVDWKPGGRGWIGTFGNESPLDATKTHAAPALLFSGMTELPHYSVRVLSPSKAMRERPVRLEWITRTDDHLQLSITKDDGAVDILDWWPERPVDGRTKLADDSGTLTRTRDGIVNEVILSNVAAFDHPDSGLKISFDAPFEGYLLRTDGGWTVYTDAFLDVPVNVTSSSIAEMSHVTLKPGMVKELVIGDEETEIRDP